MICPNCIHFEVCGDTLTLFGNFIDGVEKECKHFKNKSKTMEPPCDVGDTVYYIKGAYYSNTNLKIEPIIVTEISRKNNRSGKDLDWAIIANGTRYKFSSIGKTVFLTKKDAEQFLKSKN